MTHNEQLELWLQGKPVHNNPGGQVAGGECCPDFSCCRPELLAPVDVREVFVKAWQSGNTKVRDRMLMEFLGKSLAQSPTKVHIAGLEASRQELERREMNGNRARGSDD